MRTRFLNTHKRVCIAYPTGIIKLFSIMIISIILISCNLHSEKRVISENMTKESKLITDDEFINGINSFDFTAVVHDLYIDSENDFTGNIYCIIIEANDSLFIYKGKGSYMQRYYKNRVKGDFVKQ